MVQDEPFEGIPADVVIEYQLTRDWVLREAPAGLVLHRPGAPGPAAQRPEPPEQDHIDLFIEAEAGLEPPADLLVALARFVAEMPEDDRAWLRIRYPAGMAGSVRAAFQQAVPAPQLGWNPAAEGATGPVRPAVVTTFAPWTGPLDLTRP